MILLTDAGTFFTSERGHGVFGYRLLPSGEWDGEVSSVLPGTELPSYGPRPICVPHISSTLFRLAIVVPIVVSVDLTKEDLPSVLIFP